MSFKFWDRADGANTRETPAISIASRVPDSADTNRHIGEYLEYYLALPHEPQFAVLIDGPWGIGKTFLVKKMLAEYNVPQADYAYISLYGVSDIDGINRAIFTALLPEVSHKYARFGGHVFGAVLKYFNAEGIFSKPDLSIIARKKLYIFDDLERVEMDVNEALGYINGLVEHEGKKVIFVANEDAIKRDTGYKERKEKLIGKTLVAQSSLIEAMQNFIACVSNANAKIILEEQFELVGELYAQANINNLRILQQTIWDFERLISSLALTHLEDKNVLEAMLSLFFALSFELKSGRISSASVQARNEVRLTRMIRSQKDSEKTDIEKADDRYPGTDLFNKIFTDKILYNMLCQGIFDRERIRSCLNTSLYFETEAQPSWLTLWEGYDREPSVVLEALKDVEERYARHEYIVPGLILQIFSLRIWMASERVLPLTLADVVESGIEYIKHLYDHNLLEPTKPDPHQSLPVSAHESLMFHCRDTPEFKKLYACLDKYRTKRASDLLLTQGKELLSLMGKEPEEFSRYITTEHKGKTYHLIPVLSRIPVESFISELMTLSTLNRKTVLMGVHQRYSMGQRIDELDWVGQLKKGLLEQSEKFTPMESVQIRRHIIWYLDPILPEDAASESDTQTWTSPLE